MKTFLADFISLLYPRTCPACGNTLFKHEEMLCTSCLYHLPKTNFHLLEDNALEKLFWGRVNLEKASALYYFHKGSNVQHLIHQLKYKGYREIGIYLGKFYGRELLKNPLYSGINKVIPVPLHPRKKRKRGYNQSEQFAIGLAESLGIGMESESVIRTRATETQTKKSHFERWENVREIFRVVNPENLAGKHILLVDDVITTGATIEACAQALLEIPGIKLSVATIGFAV